MRSILVTGGTGTLGKHVVERLVAAGCRVTVLTRQPRPGGPARQLKGDLITGEGLAAAVAGVDTIVHCATGARFRRVEQLGAQRLLELCREHAVGHFLYVSIVGIDDHPMPYYQAKLDTERLIADSGVPYTVQRATQFHDLALRIVSALAAPPVALVPRGFAVQSIDVEQVAGRVAELALGNPVGRARDIGGPRVQSVAELLEEYSAAIGRRRRVVRVPVPGKIGRAFEAGLNLLGPDGERLGGTFADFLSKRLSQK